MIFLGKIKKLLQKFKQGIAISALRSARTRAAKRRITACAVPNVFRIFHVLAEKTFHKDSFFKKTTVINTIIPTKQPKINVKRLKNNPKLIFGKNCKKPQKISTKIYRRIYIG